MQANTYKWINNVNGWIVFAISFFVYASTAESTASLWDCGEFIAGAYKLQIVHPPGAPLFLMVNRIFTLFASEPSMAAYMVNISSALFTAFAILFLYWIISSIAKKLLTQDGEVLTADRVVAIQGAAWVGALACTFSDTMWFSAVEGEVYAMSTFFIAAVLWAVMRWENADDDKYANRWLVLTAYLIGLSIGVHLLSLLVIPIAVLIYYFKKYQPTVKGFLLAFFIGFVILGIVQIGVIQILTSIAAKIELFAVNSIGMPYHTGIIITYTAAFAALIAAIVMAHKWKHANLHLAAVSLLMIMIGFSSYMMVPIRAAAQTPINMNDPKDVFSLMSYLNREQYGDRPLVKGPLYTAAPYSREDAGQIFFKDTENGNYGVKGVKSKYLYREEDKILFPRMSPTNDGETAAMMYQYWVPHVGTPSFADNMGYFWRYQFGFMYWRYFMWNFAGRQDDYQGTFENETINGNWISGVPFVDDTRLGSQSDLPKQIANQKGRNQYYLLPFLFGLIGLAFMYNRNKQYTIIFGLLFLITGFFLIVYFNSPPREPRERDYVLVGSFYTFCIFIGLAVAAIYHELTKRKVSGMLSAVAISIIGLFAVPLLMASENWDDHNRSERYMARDFAINYLESCPPNAILVTAGDNDTYPLWYAQEVEGIRPDVRVMNTSLLQIDWYIDHLQRAANESAPVPFFKAFTPDKYRGDSRTFLRYFANNAVFDQNQYLDLPKAMNFILSDRPAAKANTQGGESVNYLPAKKFRLKVDKEAVMAAGIIPPGMEDRVVDEILWEFNRDIVIKDEIAMMMLIAGADWSRPLCFANTVPSSKYLGLDKYLVQEGLVYRFVPIRFEENQRGMMAVNADRSIDIVQNKFRYGGLETGEMFVDENSARMMNTLKLTHFRLADDLVRQGRFDEAVQILNQVKEKFIYENAPYYSPYNSFFNLYNVQWIDLYLRAGDKEAAAGVYTLFLEDLADCHRFYRLPNKFARAFQSELASAEDFVRRLEQMALYYEDQKLLDQLNKKFPSLVVSKTISEGQQGIIQQMQ